MGNKILIVDGSETFVDLLLYTLESGGHTNNSIACDGKEGLNKASKEKFDLIITDINMPKINGFKLISKIKEDPKYKKTPILVLSSLFDDESKKKARERGAIGWIVKPFLPNQLLKAVNLCLNTN